LTGASYSPMAPHQAGKVTPMDDVRIAAVCMNCIIGDPVRNLDKTEAIVQEAAGDGADFICFPELSVTGYIQEAPEMIYSLEVMHTLLDRLVSTAKKHRVVLMAGLIEVSNSGKPYITHMVAAPDGVIGRYRKTHLGPTEQTLYRPGDAIDVFAIGKTTFGVQLCYEGHFPEISTQMALKGADILFIPHASPRGEPEEKLKSWMRHLPARAFDNGVFVVACNQVGNAGSLNFPGVAVVFGPDGHMCSKYIGKEEHILYVDLREQHLQNVRTHRMRYFLPERRPSLYDKESGGEDQ